MRDNFRVYLERAHPAFLRSSCFRHCLLCNILTTMLKPNFEDPINSAKQIIENNITLFVRTRNKKWYFETIRSQLDNLRKASHSRNT